MNEIGRVEAYVHPDVFMEFVGFATSRRVCTDEPIRVILALLASV
jgi:hypothetical protein